MTERLLATILVADVVGYSNLVDSDQAGTLAKLQRSVDFGRVGQLVFSEQRTFDGTSPGSDLTAY